MPSKPKKTKNPTKPTWRLTIPLPFRWRLYIPARHLRTAIVLGLCALYLLRCHLKQQVAGPRVVRRQVAHPHNVPAPVPAMTTAAALPDKEDIEGVPMETEASIVGGNTTIGGKVYRLPLTTESYVVEVRQVVGTKGAGEA